MKYGAWVLFILSSARLCGGDFRSFERFRAPSIVGAYYNTWRPLGPKIEGFNFDVGFYLVDGGESRPTHFWIRKKSGVMIEVNSITAVNRVVDDLEFKSNDATLRSIDAACRMFRTQIAAFGPSDLPLDFQDPGRLAHVIRQLTKAGLDQSTADLLLSLGSKASRSVDQAARRWTAVWYQVDKLGGIERVTLSGSLEPFNVVSVLHEAVYGAAKVRPDILKEPNFFERHD